MKPPSTDMWAALVATYGISGLLSVAMIMYEHVVKGVAVSLPWVVGTTIGSVMLLVLAVLIAKRDRLRKVPAWKWHVAILDGAVYALCVYAAFKFDILGFVVGCLIAMIATVSCSISSLHRHLAMSSKALRECRDEFIASLLKETDGLAGLERGRDLTDVREAGL